MRAGNFMLRVLMGTTAIVAAATASAQTSSAASGRTQSDLPAPITTNPGMTAGSQADVDRAREGSPPAVQSSAAAPAIEPSVPQTDAASPSQEAPTAQDVVVTGSRVLRTGAASPTPLTTVSTQSLQLASPAGTLSDGLNNLPVFSGSRNQFSNAGANATGVQGGNGNANVLNLRNLGFYRTLVLFDGHRIPPTLFNSAVDVDLIPQELIERVDVVTGGVSAVYGSDAVSGVVNFIPNRHFSGIRGHAELGVSERGDDRTRDVGLAAGTNLIGGRAHVEFSYQHRENDGILDRVGSRSWLNLAAVEGGGTAANPYNLYTNVHLAAYTFGGIITNGALARQQFGSNGVLGAFTNGTVIPGASCCQVGGDGAYQDSSMIAPLKSNQLFGRVDLDVTSGIHAYVVGAANLKTNTNYTGWNTLAGLTFSATNAFLAPAYQSRLAAAGQSTFALSEIWSNAPRLQNVSNTDQYYVNAGLEGALGRFKWDATYTHGTSRLETRANNLINQQNLSAALDAVVNPATGQVVCNASLTSSAYASCVPLNLFGPTAGNAAAINYVLANVIFRTRTAQDSADASIHGTLVEGWAGPITAALSGEWRRQTFSATSTGLPSQFANCAGLRYNCTPTTTLYSTTFPYSPTVAQSVKEGAAEIEVPLLRDLFLAKSIDLNAAGRYTDYSTSGRYWTWKVGATWDVGYGLKFRSTVSHDIRAPTLYDLFQPTTTVYGNYTDVLPTFLNASASARTAYLPSINVGNPNLTAENGYTFTAGAVFQPSFVPGLTLTVDTYRTLIRNAILTVQGFNAAVQQACYASGGASAYCSLIARPGGAVDGSAANAATAYYIQPQNIARQRTYGVDVEVDYNRRISGHQAGARFLLNYQPHIYYEQPGVVTIDQGGAGWGTNGLIPSAAVLMSAFVNYNVTDHFRVDLFERYRGPFRRSGVPNQVFLDPTVAAFASTNVTFTLDVPNPRPVDNLTLTFSITNLLDKDPPLSGYYSGATSAGGAYEFSDDPVGRAFYFGVRFKV